MKKVISKAVAGFLHLEISAPQIAYGASGAEATWNEFGSRLEIFPQMKVKNTPNRPQSASSFVIRVGLIAAAVTTISTVFTIVPFLIWSIVLGPWNGFTTGALVALGAVGCAEILAKRISKRASIYRNLLLVAYALSSTLSFMSLQGFWYFPLASDWWQTLEEMVTLGYGLIFSGITTPLFRKFMQHKFDASKPA